MWCILLIVASIVSALLGEWIDASAILAIVVLNTVLGIVQERRAEEALAALKRLAAPEAHVLRGGRRVSVAARNLVPGDIVFLEAGNYVPADVRLLEAVNLRIEEASLTGESLPVQKNAASVLDKNVPLGDRRNTAFMGTLVSYGRGRGVVTSTGMHTQLGLIASHAAKCRCGSNALAAPARPVGPHAQHRHALPGGGCLRGGPDQLHRHPRLVHSAAFLSSTGT